MSNLFQPGQHPDADQLSAFVEHALPAHERNDLLAHLAVCTECREVVALSMPDAETQAAPAVQPARTSRLYKWTVLIPTAAAFAALALVMVFFHRTTVRHSIQPAQMAASHPPAAVPRPTQLPRFAVVAPERKTAPSRKFEPAPGVEKQMTVAPLENGAEARSVPRALGGKTENALAPLPRPLPAAPATASGQRTIHGSTFSEDLAAGSVSAQPAREQQRRFSAAKMAPPQRPTTQTVEVQAANAAPIELAPTDAVAGNIVSGGARTAVLQRLLPSRLAVLSMTASGSRVLAIDAHHAVFLSEDSGRHWKAVPIVWQGRAVKAETIAIEAGHPQAIDRLKSDKALFHASPVRSAAGAPNGSLSGAVTDITGAIVPGATVTLTNAETHVTRTLKSDGSGRYDAAGLAPGSYEIAAQAPGFNTLHLAGVAVSPSRQNVANLELSAGTASESVTVESASPAIAVSSAPPSPAAIPATAAPPDVFEITTDHGEHWTSADGLTWQRK